MRWTILRVTSLLNTALQRTVDVEYTTTAVQSSCSRQSRCSLERDWNLLTLGERVGLSFVLWAILRAIHSGLRYTPLRFREACFSDGLYEFFTVVHFVGTFFVARNCKWRDFHPVDHLCVVLSWLFVYTIEALRVSEYVTADVPSLTEKYTSTLVLSLGTLYGLTIISFLVIDLLRRNGKCLGSRNQSEVMHGDLVAPQLWKFGKCDQDTLQYFTLLLRSYHLF